MPKIPSDQDANPKSSDYEPNGPHIKPVNPSFLELFERDADEQLICQINKHPIGVFGISAVTLLMFFIILGATYMVLRFAPVLGTENPAFRVGITIGMGLLAYLILVGGYIAAWVYARSALIVTSEKLVQLLQRSLLNRKVSQLSIGDIQDVTVFQKGLFPRLFNYGTIIIETAGEQQNYTFNFVPYPFECSKEIVGAHERNLKLYGN